MADEKPNKSWLGSKSRKISERIIVEGTLFLETPASLSIGDADGDTDISLLRDPYDGRALLTGASITGALRNYLRECSLGFRTEEFIKTGGERDEGHLEIVTRLFGSLEDDGEQSHLIVDDALQSAAKPETELRDGVKIKAEMRTAEEGKKFDYELLQAGTEFPLRFELLITNYKKRAEKDSNAPPRKELIQALATALQGFEKSQIHLGGRKRRGYGQCRVSKWDVTRYNLEDKDGLLAWIDCRLGDATKVRDKDSIAAAFKEACELNEEPELKDNRSYFNITACFALDGSMLIRSGSALGEGVQPDTVHLRSNRRQKDGQKKGVPIVSGTSLAGVLRHRALRIAKTIAHDAKRANEFVEGIFGVDMDELKIRNKKSGKNEQPFASRLEVRETEIENSGTLIHSRVRIDRFTGGAYEGALFDAAPIFGEGKKAVAVVLKLQEVSLKNSTGKLESNEEKEWRTKAEIGLLLLLLKDLWTGDLAIGGESSIGRGRLRGIGAILERKGWTQPITLAAEGECKVKHEGYEGDGKGRMELLNDFVVTLKQELNRERKNENG